MGVNQTIDAIASTVKIGGSYTLAAASQLSQGKILRLNQQQYSVTPEIGAKYQWKKMEFLLDYTNIFNSKQYISASYSNTGSYYYAYDLRPAEVLLRVRFKLK